MSSPSSGSHRNAREQSERCVAPNVIVSSRGRPASERAIWGYCKKLELWRRSQFSTGCRKQMPQVRQRGWLFRYEEMGRRFRSPRHHFKFANRPPRLARRLHGPRRRQSSPSHNAWPENRSTAVAGRCGISPRLLPHVTASLEPYSHAAVARMIDEANGSAAGLHRPLASVASKSAGRVSRGCQLTPDRGPILARHNMAMAEELEMSDWKLFYQDENGRDAQSTHSSRETTIVQALQLARRCHIE
jgi:hypothetical protein